MTIAEQLVAKYGEGHRKLIVDSLDWLNQREDKWGLDAPIDVDEFIADLIKKHASQ